MNDFISFATMPENVAFTTAVAVMLLIGAVAALGIDLDADGGFFDLPLFDWANPGKIPFLAWLTIFAMIYGIGGLAGQSLLQHLTGSPLPAWIASLGALPIALAATKYIATLAAPIIPRDETSAIHIEDLVGRRGRLETGTAREGQPARARFRDVHGQSHYLMVEPVANSGDITQGDELLLISVNPPLGIRVEHDPFHPGNPV